MPWSDNSGSRGPTRGPWGGQPQKPTGGDNGGSRGSRGGEPPDLEELLQASRQRLKRAFPGGRGGRGGGVQGPTINAQTIAAGAGIFALLWIASGVYQVEADELAVVTTFGKFSHVSPPGLHWRAPFPFQGVQREKVTTSRQASIFEGSREGGAGLMLTRDKNIVDIELTVQYRIKPDIAASRPGEFPAVAQYVFNVDDPVAALRTVSEASIREVVGRNPLEYVQTQGRSQIQDETRTLIQQTLDLYKTGIEVTEVNLLKADPPTQEVNAAFLDVNAAEQDRDATINGARAYENKVVAEASGRAQKMLEDARGYAARVTAEARGQASRFDSILTEYQRAPEVTRQRMYLETVERVLAPMNKIIVEEDAGRGVVPYLPLNELQRPRAVEPQGNQ